MSEETSDNIEEPGNIYEGSYAKFPAVSEIVALVLALIPFCAHTTTTSTRTVNDWVVESSYTDFVAIACGILAYQSPRGW